jgi:hypothetical protein
MFTVTILMNVYFEEVDVEKGEKVVGATVLGPLFWIVDGIKSRGFGPPGQLNMVARVKYVY